MEMYRLSGFGNSPIVKFRLIAQEVNNSEPHLNATLPKVQNHDLISADASKPDYGSRLKRDRFWESGFY